MELKNYLYGTFIKRYKRFFVNVKIDNDVIITAHCPNTGPMTDLLTINSKVLITKINSKLGYQWQIYYEENSNITTKKHELVPIGINTHTPNKLFEELLMTNNSFITSFNNNVIFKKEFSVKDGKYSSRFDFIINNMAYPQIIKDYMFSKDYTPNFNPQYPTLLEIKNVHWKIKDGAYFPDCPTTRGSKHVAHLIYLINNKKYNGALIFIAQREDINFVSISYDKDPIFHNLVKQFLKIGGIVMAFKSIIFENTIKIKNIIPFKL